MATAGNITAVLTLNSSGFKTGLESAISSLDKFKSNASSISGSIQILEKTLTSLDTTLSKSESSLRSVNAILSNNKNFNEFALAINRIATAFKTLSSSQTNVEMSMNVINSILREVQSIAGNSTIKVQGLASALRELRQAESSTASSTEETSASETEKQKLSADEMLDAFLKYCEENNIRLIVIPYTFYTYNRIKDALVQILIEGKNPDEVIKQPEVEKI